MRHWAIKILAITLAALASACAAPLRLPDGVYADSHGRSLTVAGKYIVFRVPADEPGILTNSTTVIYRLDDDGALRLSGSSNSSVFVFFVIEQEWRWTGSAIESTNRIHGKVVTYAPLQ